MKIKRKKKKIMTIFSATIAAEDLKMEKLFGNVQNAKTICFAPIATS